MFIFFARPPFTLTSVAISETTGDGRQRLLRARINQINGQYCFEEQLRRSRYQLLEHLRHQ